MTGHTALSLMKNVGKIGKIRTPEGLLFPVRITDAKIRFGQEDFCIVPLHGDGEAWVLGSRVMDVKDPVVGNGLVHTRIQEVHR